MSRSALKSAAIAEEIWGPELDLVCAWCKRVFVDGEWCAGIAHDSRLATHGICADCRAGLLPSEAPGTAR